MLVNLSEAQPKHGITLSAARLLKDLVLFCPKPYFRLVNNSKQQHKHKVHEKLIRLHIKNTETELQLKRYKQNKFGPQYAKHQEAHFGAMHKQYNEWKHAHK